MKSALLMVGLMLWGTDNFAETAQGTLDVSMNVVPSCELDIPKPWRKDVIHTALVMIYHPGLKMISTRTIIQKRAESPARAISLQNLTNQRSHTSQINRRSRTNHPGMRGPQNGTTTPRKACTRRKTSTQGESPPKRERSPVSVEP